MDPLDQTLSLIEQFVLEKNECKILAIDFANYGNALKEGFLVLQMR